VYAPSEAPGSCSRDRGHTDERRDFWVIADLLVEGLDILREGLEVLRRLSQGGEVGGSSIRSGEGVKLDRGLKTVLASSQINLGFD
jgi:hypothetical protein